MRIGRTVKQRSLFAAGLLLVLFLSGAPAWAQEDATALKLAPSDRGLPTLDWIVLGAYAVGMLGIGWHYSRRNRSADDYLLGGRQMRPWIVGLSMFATFFSALTYLALPGEMIAHGPMMLAQVFGFPIVAVGVCLVVIPYIMRFQVTSGYEILETRLGESVRLLAALTFLLVRFLWMGLMIYATVDKVLVPVAGIDSAWVPHVCVGLGLITVVYSSMGGLRAVVLSDAIQAIILLSGAVLAVVLITVDLGSVSSWWPTRWQPHWDPFRVWFSPGSRMSLVEPIMSVSLWWIATAASDQMAIQRYLATRDKGAARRMFTISVVANIFIASILGLLGFAVLAYFQHHPEALRAGQSVTTNADQLFPRYMTVGLLPGLSGIVIAALLAATMSSLSAGVNSASSVIAADLLGRFRRTAMSEEERLRIAKVASWAVGFIAILLSLGVPLVKGNLLELCYRLPNLFTGPLFILFFMAMFVRWATPLGTWVAAIASATVAVGIGFFGWFDLGFLWVVIGSILTGVVVGPVVSLLPFGRRTRPLGS